MIGREAQSSAPEQAVQDVAGLERQHGEEQPDEGTGEQPARSATRREREQRRQEDRADGKGDARPPEPVHERVDRPVEDRDRRVGTERRELLPLEPWRLVEGEAGRNHRGRREQRPPQPARVAERAEGGEHEEGEEVEEVAVVDDQTHAEPQVEDRHLEEEQDGHGHRHARERMLVRSRRGRGEVRERPGKPDERGQDPDPKRDGGEVLEHAAEEVRRHAAAEHPRVDAEDGAQVPDRLEHDRRRGARRIDGCQERVPQHDEPQPGADPRERARRGGATDLEEEQGERQGQPEDGELGAGKERQREASEREEVVPARGGGDRALHPEHSPEERRIGRHLREQVGRIDDRRDHDREHGEQVSGPVVMGDATREQEGRDAGGGHDPGVEDVRLVQVVRDQAGAEDRRDQQWIELAEARDQIAAQVWQGCQVAGAVDRQPLVHELVGHHEPVADAAGHRGEPGREHDPDRRQHEGRVAQGDRVERDPPERTARRGNLICRPPHMIYRSCLS